MDLRFSPCPELYCDWLTVPNLPLGMKSKCSRFSEFHGNKKVIAEKILNPLSKFLSPCISKFYGEATNFGPGSFTVQFGNHLRACMVISWLYSSSNPVAVQSIFKCANMVNTLFLWPSWLNKK